jgi:hypothetical protein
MVNLVSTPAQRTGLNKKTKNFVEIYFNIVKMPILRYFGAF